MDGLTFFGITLEYFGADNERFVRFSSFRFQRYAGMLIIFVGSRADLVQLRGNSAGV